MKVLAASLLLTMASCAPFVETNDESTTIGVTLNHRQAAEWFFNIFSTPPNLVNEK